MDYQEQFKQAVEERKGIDSKILRSTKRLSYMAAGLIMLSTANLSYNIATGWGISYRAVNVFHLIITALWFFTLAAIIKKGDKMFWSIRNVLVGFLIGIQLYCVIVLVLR